MKLNIKIYIALVAISIVSCDTLEQEPISVIASENFFQNEEQVNAALSATYDVLQSGAIGRDFKASATAASDESTTSSSGGNNNRANDHAINADHGPARDLWRALYQGIHRTNDIIENLPNISDPALDLDNRREQYMGEARFLRGFFYWNLLKWYGPVPVILNTTQSSDPAVLNVERTPLPQVYEQVIEDLEYGEQFLPTQYASEVFTRGRATKGAAQAVLSKVFLRRAYTDFADGGDFQASADYAKKVIDNSGLYRLVPADNYFTMFEAGAGNTSESIFEIQTETIEINSSDDLYREFEASENGPRARARIVPNQKLIDAFNTFPGDIRKDAVLKPMDPEQNAGFSFYINKHNVGEGQLIPNLVLIRLADIMLVRAEALNALNQTADAIALLNTVRNRAQIPPTTATSPADIFQAIQDERFVELAFEGHRWHDLSRFPANNYEWARMEYAETEERSQMSEDETYQLLWPINNRELDVNDKLEQNPGYN
ncbi:RagB/SusD family nutrient uptake outer membrane protein [Galbibacter mesophilus]|uniref:RagB/SusD family nutrient uptake outer membrane protein n=1 Tax=Galbibacter mesophilus TaxID=379069 RepID=UPI00191FB196|nr:RagB/SusD family nutrient uptake outer membrane protein [Galbibacter mesophilus]MCM5663176.1 RagB/SusD family nutrient uptake outer membrane protein [Galbibacter mesophilus]